MWIGHEAPRNETAVERLRRESDELDREAKSMVGCSWCGDGPPWLAIQRDASDKRLLATLLERQSK